MSMAARRFWEKREKFYPYKVNVDHMSKADVDPSKFRYMTKGEFLRVPFDGVAHWGFKDAVTRDDFLKARVSS